MTLADHGGMFLCMQFQHLPWVWPRASNPSQHAAGMQPHSILDARPREMTSLLSSDEFARIIAISSVGSDSSLDCIVATDESNDIIERYSQGNEQLVSVCEIFFVD